MSVVRESKFRHIYATQWRKELNYENLKAEDPLREGNPIAANNTFIAVPWKVGGGGCLAVWPKNKVTKLPDTIPVIAGHTAPVLCFDFNPFDDHVVATGSEDAHVKVWRVPSEDGLSEDLTTPEADLIGHNSKVLTTDFHPTARNILVSSGSDNVVKFWDVEKASEALTFDKNPDLIYNISWDHRGAKFASYCRDKNVRVCDPRSNQVVQQTMGHTGTRGGRVIWKGEEDKLITVGFSKMSERQISLYDTRKISAPLRTTLIDQGSGYMMPYLDEANGVLFVAGKGDSNIRFYEINDKEPFIHYLNEWRGTSVIRGLVKEHRTNLDVKSVEIMRFMKLTVTGSIETVQFFVPRKSDYFQDDLYPPTPAYGAPGIEGASWAQGYDCDAEGLPKVDLQPAGTIAQSKAPKEEKKGPKYNFDEEVKKGAKTKSAQEAVFDRWSSHIFAIGEEEEQNKADSDSDSDWD